MKYLVYLSVIASAAIYGAIREAKRAPSCISRLGKIISKISSEDNLTLVERGGTMYSVLNKENVNAIDQCLETLGCIENRKSFIALETKHKDDHIKRIRTAFTGVCSKVFLEK